MMLSMGFGIWSKSIYCGPLGAQQHLDLTLPKPSLKHFFIYWGEVPAMSDTSGLRRLSQQ